jgi:putative transcriptional regulator
MPTMSDPRFVHGVMYICSHNETGAMGIVINRLYGAIDLEGLLDQLSIPVSELTPEMSVHYGGPVESGRGFILHTDDYTQDTSMRIKDDIVLTATVDILRAIAEGRGPHRCLVALGYAGWAPGQIEQELQAGAWLTVPADADLLFDPGIEDKWERAIGKLGITPGLLSTETGHA